MPAIAKLALHCCSQSSTSVAVKRGSLTDAALTEKFSWAWSDDSWRGGGCDSGSGDGAESIVCWYALCAVSVMLEVCSSLNWKG